MRLIIKSIIVACLVLHFNLDAVCENIVIIESQSFDQAHNMDEQWKSISMEKGLSVDIYPQTKLDFLSNLAGTQILIISSGLIEINSDRLQVIEQFIQQGGHVYLQSEYQIQSSGNQVFAQLVDNLGGTFNWEGEMSGDLTPMKITNGFSSEEDFIPYFWFGAFGSGDNSIIPFIEKDSRDYGFYFCSPNAQDGKLITVSDQDWIRYNMKPELMHEIIDFCLQYSSFQLPQVQVISSEDSPCLGEWVTYSLDIETSSMSVVEYQWYINDLWIPDAKEPTFTKKISEGEEISCTIHMENACAIVEISSNKVDLLSDQDEVKATIQIETDSSNTFCEGTPITFTATPGFNKLPSDFSFEWFINEIKVEEAKGATFICGSLNEKDKVACNLVYELPCEKGLLVPSNEIEISFWKLETMPIISIQALDNIECEGEPISFLATGFDSGDITSFVWKVNGEEVYEGSEKFTLNTPEDGQVITCDVAINSPCLTDQLVASSSYVMDLKPVVIPEFHIEVGSTKVCKGESLQVQILNSENLTDFQYQWQVNGNNVGIDNPILNLENIETLQSIQCIVTINADCPSPVEVTTESLQIEVMEPVDMEVEIFTKTPAICKGELIEIDVIGKNLPENIVYQWFSEEKLIHTCTTPIFSCDSIFDQQKLRCEIIIPDQECNVGYTLVSNTIQVTVSEIALDVIELQPEICGEDGKIEVEAYDGIDTYSYEWNDGSSATTRSNLSAGDYSLTISDALGCQVEEMLTINEKKDSIYAAIEILSYDPKINYGMLNVETNAVSPVFSWNTPHGLSCVDCPRPLVEGGYVSSYEVTVTDNRGCSTKGYFEMPVDNKTSTKNIYIPNAFTPNDDGANDYFTAYGYNDDSSINSMRIFNERGVLVFERSNLLLSDEENGWDGRNMNNRKLETGVYLYVITVQMEDQLITYKGDVTKL